MTELFDRYRSNYRDVVQSSIDFSRLPHSFFMHLMGQFQVAKYYSTTNERAKSEIGRTNPILIV